MTVITIKPRGFRTDAIKRFPILFGMNKVTRKGRVCGWRAIVSLSPDVCQQAGLKYGDILGVQYNPQFNSITLFNTTYFDDGFKLCRTATKPRLQVSWMWDQSSKIPLIIGSVPCREYEADKFQITLTLPLQPKNH